MSAKVIAFLNFKGGVGKTANVVNLGACLAHVHRRRVLVVDLDPQCNSTFWLMRRTEFLQVTDSARRAAKIQQTTFQIFKDALCGTSLFNLKEAVVRGVPRNEVGTEIIPLLHLLQGAIDLLDIEFDVMPNTVHRFRPSLRKALTLLQEDYDYILLDCPPNLYHVARAAVFAAHNIVVPYNPDYLSLSGFQMLCRQLRKLDDAFQGSRPQLARNQVCAVTVNRYDKRGNVFGTAIAELKSQIDVLKKEELVHPNCIVLEPSIRQDVRISESTSEHKPVILHSPHSIGSSDYLLLAEAFIQHFEHNL